MTDLSLHIQQTTLMNTHEHTCTEASYLENAPDVLQDIINQYMPFDLVCAGAAPEAVARAQDASDPDIAARFLGIRDAWQRCHFTGYGEAARLVARQAYGIEEITAESLVAAQEKFVKPAPGDRLRLLRDGANLDHVQIDDWTWPCLPDESGPEFFLYDLSWRDFCNGYFDVAKLHQETGVEVRDLETLREAMTALFAKYAPCATAVKTQHAYERTLLWQERAAADVERALQKKLAGVEIDEADRLCLGDWGLARGVELAIAHNLPVKIHTGYLARYGTMIVDNVRAGNLCALLKKYPQARFVLMHISYPYNDELVALAKHFANVYVDLCFAWCLDPYTSSDFVRRMIHAVPSHKLFAFGGDAFWPNTTIAFATQARHWLTRSFRAEIDEGLMTEPEAIGLATRFMRENQSGCFDLPGTRAAIAASMQTSASR